jgi:hypothetical protein
MTKEEFAEIEVVRLLEFPRREAGAVTDERRRP